MAAAAILNFTKSNLFGTMPLIWPMSIYTPNLTQLSSLATEIWQKKQIQDGGRRHLKFYQKWDIGFSLPSYCYYLSAHQL